MAGSPIVIGAHTFDDGYSYARMHYSGESGDVSCGGGREGGGGGGGGERGEERGVRGRMAEKEKRKGSRFGQKNWYIS